MFFMMHHTQFGQSLAARQYQGLGKCYFTNSLNSLETLKSEEARDAHCVPTTLMINDRGKLLI
jgi:hypothetical protein